MSRRFLITLVTVIVILAVAGIAVFLAKGYTFSATEGKFLGTGIISVTSIPSGASVYIDGHLTTATDTTISSLPPKTYQIKIVKEGFISWERQIAVKEGLVSEVKATLFPSLPTIYPLTYNGVINPTLSPDGQHLAFAVPIVSDGSSRQKGGIWIWNFASQPIAFSRSAEPHQIIASTGSLDFSKSTFRFSPDSKQLLMTLQEGEKTGTENTRNYLLPVDSKTSLDNLNDITPSVSTTLRGWEEDQKTKETTLMAQTILDPNLRKIASDSAGLKWSPDESKFITTEAVASSKPQSPQPGLSPTPTPVSRIKGKVYDLSIATVSKEHLLPEALFYHWLPDSEHIILVQEDRIEIAEFDGQNVAVIYAGKFEPESVFAWPDASRLVITTSFPTPTASTPNLFGINLK